MFKLSTYSFQYRLTEINQFRNTENTENPWFLPFIETSTTRNSSPIVWFINERQWRDDKFLCNVQINYQNDLTQDIFTNEDINNLGAGVNPTWVLLSTQTVLWDMFFVFCFNNLPFNLNDRRQTENLMKWMMFVFYDGRSTLLSTAIRILEDRIFQWNITNVVPIFRDATPLRDMLQFIDWIHVKGLLDRDRRKTGMNIMVSREMFEQDFDLLDQVGYSIEQFMWQALGEIKYTAQILGRKVPIVTDRGVRILQSVPELLELSDQDQRTLDNFTSRFNNRDRNRNFDFVEQLSQLTESIMNNMANHN